jgi:hypothetical protein
MFYIACTRFNKLTYKENLDYRINNKEEVIYGAALKIRNIYSAGSLMFVAEMNNETNKIEGIGLIKNSLVSDKRHKIYENNDYNRYIYRGNYWLSRNQIENLDNEIIEILDNILFKGKSHLKFRTGITILTEKLFTHWNYELRTLKNKIKFLFIDYFNLIKDNHNDENEFYNEVEEKDEEKYEEKDEEKDKEKDKEEFEIIPIKKGKSKSSKSSKSNKSNKNIEK